MNCICHLSESPGPLGRLEEEGLSRCCPLPRPPSAIPLCPGTHRLFFAFPISSWVRLPDPLQSSGHCDLVGVGVRFFPGTFLRGRDYFLINSNSVFFPFLLVVVLVFVYFGVGLLFFDFGLG